MSFFGNRTARTTAPGYSIIDDRMTIRGDIETDGTVRIEGKIEGTHHRAGTMIVTSHGGVVGDVEAGDVTVSGTIRGNVHASGRDRVELMDHSRVYGDVNVPVVIINEGALFEGQCRMTRPNPAETQSGLRDGSIVPLKRSELPR